MLKRILLLIITAIFITGCSSKNLQEEISFATWGSVTEINIIKKLIKSYEQENPNIKIKLVHIPQNYFQKLHLLFASKTPPDVIFINNLNLPIYSKHLEPLEEFIIKEDFFIQSIDCLSDNGHIYAFPRDISNLVLYVNLDKTTLPKQDWTIDNLLQKSKETTNLQSFGISYEDSLYWITPYLTYFGGGILDNNLNLIIYKQESKDAIKFYKNLKELYKVAPNKSQVGSLTLGQMFIEGKICFYLSGRWMFPKISEQAKFNWAVINFPYGEKPQLCDSSGWSISKDSKHKEAALNFVKYISGETASKYFTETGLIIPARKSTSEFINSNKHNESVFLDVIEHSSKTPVNKNYSKITDKLNLALDL